MLGIKCSHGLGFFPRLPPDVDTMPADEDRTWIWVFLHRPSHSVFQVLLFWCIFNDRHNQGVVIPGICRVQNDKLHPGCFLCEALTFAIIVRCNIKTGLFSELDTSAVQSLIARQSNQSNRMTVNQALSLFYISISWVSLGFGLLIEQNKQFEVWSFSAFYDT